MNSRNTTASQQISVDQEVISQIFVLFEENFKSSLAKCKNDLEVVSNNMHGYVELFKQLTVSSAGKKLQKAKRTNPRKKVDAVATVEQPVKVEEKPLKVKKAYVKKHKVEDAISTVEQPLSVEDKPVKAKRTYKRKEKIDESVITVEQPKDSEIPQLEVVESKVSEVSELAVNEPEFEVKANSATIDIKNMDSLTGMKSLPDACVDLVLSDPPYGIASKNKMTMKNNKLVSTMEAWGNDFKDAWNSVEEYWEWFKPFVAEMFRVMKDGASMILFLDRKYIGLITYYIEKEFKLKFKNNLYFVKNNPCPSFFKNQYRSNMETAVWFSKGSAKTFNFGEQKDMKQTFIGNLGKKFFLDGLSHPTEKYAFMIEPLIENHSAPGQVVLDPFSGSGTTLIHAKRKNRNAIGFELNQKFYNIAKTRADIESGRGEIIDVRLKA